MGAPSRYELLVRIAAGGMATVHLARLRGAEGFWRLVAIKRAHPHLLEDPELCRMLIAEARMASRLHHPNVVAIQDVERIGGELLLVMDYVEGSTLSRLETAATVAGRPIPPGIVLRVALDACAGLSAVHALVDETGKPLRPVHRDVSPQNILVGADGAARLADFGIAKCALDTTRTATGALKGKVAYMAPEYILSGVVDPRGDVFALAVILWEALSHRRLFRGANDVMTLKQIVETPAPPLSAAAPSLGTAFDAVIARALEKAPERRFERTQDFRIALEGAARQAGCLASEEEVGDLVRALAGASIEAMRTQVMDAVARDGSPRSTAPAHPLETPEPMEPTARLPTATVRLDQELSTLSRSASTRRAAVVSIHGSGARLRAGARKLAFVAALLVVAAIFIATLRGAPQATASASTEPAAAPSVSIEAPPPSEAPLPSASIEAPPPSALIKAPPPSALIEAPPSRPLHAADAGAPPATPAAPKIRSDPAPMKSATPTPPPAASLGGPPPASSPRPNPYH
jgi:eukaryotic-like serine/threonine-protein kinase